MGNLQQLPPSLDITQPFRIFVTKEEDLTTKVCRRCFRSQEISDFPSKKNGKIPSWCKACCKDYRQGEGKEKARLRSRKYSLTRLYGLSVAEYERLFDAQGRRCKICRSVTPRGGRWCVDHDHSAEGKILVRGILCMHCNALLGFASDDIRIMQRAISYLLIQSPRS